MIFGTSFSVEIVISKLMAFFRNLTKPGLKTKAADGWSRDKQTGGWSSGGVVVRMWETSRDPKNVSQPLSQAWRVPDCTFLPADGSIERFFDPDSQVLAGAFFRDETSCPTLIPCFEGISFTPSSFCAKASSKVLCCFTPPQCL